MNKLAKWAFVSNTQCTVPLLAKSVSNSRTNCRIMTLKRRWGHTPWWWLPICFCHLQCAPATTVTGLSILDVLPLWLAWSSSVAVVTTFYMVAIKWCLRNIWAFRTKYSILYEWLKSPQFSSLHCFLLLISCLSFLQESYWSCVALVFHGRRNSYEQRSPWREM